MFKNKNSQMDLYIYNSFIFNKKKALANSIPKIRIYHQYLFILNNIKYIFFRYF
jgi:hypothetical protein